VSAATPGATPGRLTLDRLPDPGAPVEVRRVEGLDVRGRTREPHRHDYHELIWVRSGTGRHLLDGSPVPVLPRTVTLIGRGQVHIFERAERVHGAVVRFGEELLPGAPGERAGPGWLLAGRAGTAVEVPADGVKHLEATIAALEEETSRRADPRSPELQRHLLSVLLLWVERWFDAARTERHEPDDPELRLHRRFAELLEADFPRHHDAGHYADALRVPPAALARALTRVTGRSTKELVTDRVMLEAARLLRFTDLTVGEVAHGAGYGDQLYFSRAFKRHHGEAPVAYRQRVRGRSPA
jgi:AraC family transcriptional activator of pobA